MSYEYRTDTYAGPSPPSILTPPPGFRFRDMKYVQTGFAESHTTGWEYQAAGRLPFTQSISGSSYGQWVVIWERYVPDKEEE